MTARTQAEIAAEIEALKKLKPRVRRFTAFGDDNHRQIDIQIEVLEKNLDEDAINYRYEASDENSAAYEALKWRDGEPGVQLSEDWKALAK